MAADDVKTHALTLLLTQWERLGTSGLIALVLAVCCYLLWRRVGYLTEALTREQRRHMRLQDETSKEYIHSIQELLNEFLRSQLSPPKDGTND